MVLLKIAHRFHHTTVRGYSTGRSGWRVLVFGSSEFGLRPLKALHDDFTRGRDSVTSLALITGKRTPMGALASERNIPILPYPPDLQHGEYDIGVVVSFGHLIPGKIIEKFPRGVVNIHPSLLPRWRGAAPVTHTILAGDTETGVSLMKIMPKRFDIGPILMREKVPVSPNITTRELSDELSQLGTDMLMEYLCNMESHSGAKQTNEGVTYAHKLTTELSYISWTTQTCQDIDRQYRALYQQIPLRSKYLGTVIQLLDMVPLDSEGLNSNSTDSPPGSAEYVKTQGFVRVRCLDGWVGFRNVVYKKPMSAASFHNGHLSKAYNRGQVMESVDNNLLKYIHQAKVSR